MIQDKKFKNVRENLTNLTNIDRIYLNKSIYYSQPEKQLETVTVVLYRKIMSQFKKAVKNIANNLGFELREIRPEESSQYSYQEEEKIIEAILSKLKNSQQIYVDIGAANGVNGSNSFSLVKDGWGGLAVEYNGDEFSKLAYEYAKYSKVSLSKCMVTPENVLSLLKAHQIPKEFGFLTLDIDGYDYFVLEQILTEYRPSLICAEINEKMPPPIQFTMKYNPNYPGPRGHLYGQSLSQMNILCERHDYAIVQLEYNNAFLIPQEINPLPALTTEEAYRQGYLDRSDRHQKYPWNADMEEIHGLSPQEAVDFVKQKFTEYESDFICQI